MKSTLDQIEDIKNHGYSLDFSTVFNHAFENYKKIALYAGLIILVTSFIFLFAFFSVLVAYFGIESMSKDFLESFENQKLSYVELLISTIGVSFLSGILAPFGAGFLKMADCADKDQEFNVSTIFTYYKGPYFAQIFTSAFVIAVVGTAISNVLESTGLGLLGGAISIFINFFTYLAVPLIVFGDLKALDAIKSSIIVVSKNPLLIFALFIVGIIGAIIGVFACCVPVLFTLAFNTSMTYATYYGIFNMEEEDPIDAIGQSDLE